MSQVIDPQLQSLHRQAEQSLIAGRYDESAATYHDLWNQLDDPAFLGKGYGCVQFARGKYEEAVPLFERYLAQFSADLEGWRNLALLLRKLGRGREAAEAWAQVINLDTSKAEHFCEYIDCLIPLEKPGVMAQVLRQARSLYPQEPKLAALRDQFLESLTFSDQTELTLEQANVLMSLLIRWLAESFLGKRLDRLSAFVAHLRDHTELLPDVEAELRTQLRHVLEGKVVFFLTLAMIAQMTKNYPPAVRFYRAALREVPASVVAKVNLGKVLVQLRHYSEAIELMSDGTDSGCKDVDLLRGIAVSYFYLNQMDQALIWYRRALALKPEDHAIMGAIGVIGFLDHQFDLGWKYYAGRVKTPELRKLMEQLPRWQGEDLTGKTVLVLREQGFGDSINFIRYLPALAARCERVYFSVQPPLRTLVTQMKGLPKNVEVANDGAKLVGVHYCAPLMDLIRFDDPQFANPAGGGAYLQATDERRALWQQRLGKTDKLRVGLIWRGSPGHGRDNDRSLPLELFEPILFNPHCQVVSLQKGEGLDEICFYQDRLLDFQDQVKDFVDTAAIMEQLDLVVSVDTSACHLAGALGVPVWTLVSFIPDWRWTGETPQTHWYDSMKLYRQTETANWRPALARLMDDFDAWAEASIGRLSPS